MIGTEIRSWRQRTGYSQAELQRELGIKSRTSISSLENSEKPIPRSIQLALAALEIAPLLRQFYGKSKGADQKSSNFPALDEAEARELYVDLSAGVYK